MASIVLRSRLISTLSKLRSRNPRLYSTEPEFKSRYVAAPQSVFSDLPPPDLPPPPPPPPPPPSQAEAVVKGKGGFLKYLGYGLAWALTGATAATGYVSYAYTIDEVNEKTKEFREEAKKAQKNTASNVNSSASFDKYKDMMYSTSMSVSAQAIDKYLELREIVEEQVKGFTEPLSEKLLPDMDPRDQQQIFTLVLDLNETLLYTDWKRDRGWRTFKRPGVDAFLEHLSKFYEIVIYSDQMDMYVIPVCDKLNPSGSIPRLGRVATKYVNGKHYRDLSKLNRDPKRILYVSGNAFETSLQAENCVPIKPYKLESDDTTLIDLIPFLEYVARNNPADIRPVLASFERKDVAKEFLERTREFQKRKKEQAGQGRFWRR